MKYLGGVQVEIFKGVGPRAHVIATTKARKVKGQPHCVERGSPRLLPDDTLTPPPMPRKRRANQLQDEELHPVAGLEPTAGDQQRRLDPDAFLAGHALD